MSPTPSAQSTDFVRLIARIRAGDEHALERLLNAMAVSMRRMADRYIGSSLRPYVDSDDLVQRASLILWHGLRDGKFVVDSPNQLMALTRTLLRRQAAKAAQQFKPAMDSMAATGEFDFGATLVDQRIAPVPCPVKKAETNEQVRQLMERVSTEDRRMLELLLEGHTIAAAARLLQIEPATLRMRLSRLRVRVHHIRVKITRTPQSADVDNSAALNSDFCSKASDESSGNPIPA